MNAEGEEQHRVRPGNVIGSVRVGDRVVVVSPKLPIDRVLFMTVYTADPFGWRNEWAELGVVSSLTDGVAALFSRSRERALGAGLLRSYRTVERDEALVRGRIRMNVQARRMAPVPIAVRYQVHDDEVIENHVLRAAVSVLRRQRLGDDKLTFRVAHLWRQLRDLSAKRVNLDQIDRIVWTRHNAHYRPAVMLARVILANSMVDVVDGRVPVAGFTLSLPRVFEQFVRTALRESLGATTLEFPDQPSRHKLALDDHGRVKLEPDLGYRTANGWRFVGDVKYKRDAAGAGTNPDLYQLLAYATATRLPEATLIYTEGPPTPTHLVVPAAAVTLHVRHLDLNQEPTQVLETLGLWAREMLGQIGARAMDG